MSSSTSDPWYSLGIWVAAAAIVATIYPKSHQLYQLLVPSPPPPPPPLCGPVAEYAYAATAIVRQGFTAELEYGDENRRVEGTPTLLRRFRSPNMSDSDNESSDSESSDDSPLKNSKIEDKVYKRKGTEVLQDNSRKLAGTTSSSSRPIPAPNFTPPSIANLPPPLPFIVSRGSSPAAHLVLTEFNRPISHPLRHPSAPPDGASHLPGKMNSQSVRFANAPGISHSVSQGLEAKQSSQPLERMPELRRRSATPSASHGSAEIRGEPDAQVGKRHKGKATAKGGEKQDLATATPVKVASPAGPSTRAASAVPMDMASAAQGYIRYKAGLTAWFESDSSESLARPIDLSTRADIELGDVYIHRTPTSYQLWLWDKARNGELFWKAVPFGYQREDGRRLSVTPKKRNPSWVQEKWAQKTQKDRAPA